MAVAPYRIDVGDGDFEREVILRSHERPVVVDFWAAWCGPCRALGPILERLADEHAGEFVLAKLDVDRAPETAGRFGVRSIPLVLGFRDGEPVAEFLGAQPEPAVRKFLAKLLPTEADRLAAEGDELAAGGHESAAETRYRGGPRPRDAPRARAARSRADPRGTRRVRRGARAARARDGRRQRRKGRGAARGGAAYARRRPEPTRPPCASASRAIRTTSRRGSPWAVPSPPPASTRRRSPSSSPWWSATPSSTSRRRAARCSTSSRCSAATTR